jgi:hypothetical protein
MLPPLAESMSHHPVNTPRALPSSQLCAYRFILLTLPPPPLLRKYARPWRPTRQCSITCCSHARSSSSVLNQGTTALGDPLEYRRHHATIEAVASSGYNVPLFSCPKLSLWRIIAPGEVRTVVLEGPVGQEGSRSVCSRASSSRSTVQTKHPRSLPTFVPSASMSSWMTRNCVLPRFPHPVRRHLALLTRLLPHRPQRDNVGISFMTKQRRAHER